MEILFYTIILKSPEEIMEQRIKEIILNIIIYIQQKIEDFERLTKFSLHKIWNKEMRK